MKQPKRKTTKPGLADAFSKRLRDLMSERGWRVENLVAQNPSLSAFTLQSYVHGLRFPRPRSIVDLAIAFHMPTMKFLGDVPVPMETRAAIEAIDRALSRT